MPKNPNFDGVNRHYPAKRAKYYLLLWEVTLCDALFWRSVLLLTSVDRLSSIIYPARQKLPKGLYILPSVISIFLSFLSFLMISWRQIIWRSTGPIFANFTSNESFLDVDDRSGLLFSISQGTLPWQPILCKNGQNYLPPPCTYRSVTPKRNKLSFCGWAY